MACPCESSPSKVEQKEGICEVCRIQQGDSSLKQVDYCSFCGVNICCECKSQYDQRFFAMLKTKFNFNV